MARKEEDPTKIFVKAKKIPTSLLAEPIIISKSDQECCMIESSINSVRISIMIKKNMEIE